MDKTQIQNLIKELIEKTKVSVKEINIVENEGNNLWFMVEVDEPHFFISRDGEALMALNHVVRRILEPKNQEENVQALQVLVDINGFQKKRIDGIKAIAHMMAERARYFKSSVEVDPMSSFERRIVHEFLANESDIETESAGFGPKRHVVIKYTGGI